MISEISNILFKYDLNTSIILKFCLLFIILIVTSFNLNNNICKLPNHKLCKKPELIIIESKQYFF